jgi:hypothetical protein
MTLSLAVLNYRCHYAECRVFYCCAKFHLASVVMLRLRKMKLSTTIIKKRNTQHNDTHYVNTAKLIVIYAECGSAIVNCKFVSSLVIVPHSIDTLLALPANMRQSSYALFNIFRGEKVQQFKHDVVLLTRRKSL